MKNKQEQDWFHGDQWFQNQVEKRMRTSLSAMQARGEAPAGTLESLRGTVFYKEEYKRQAKLFKQERRRLAEERDKRKREVALANAAAQKVLEERDRVWAKEHEKDTDQQLLEYIRSCAAQLGHSPRRREVLGSTYIAGRFGNWSVALMIAGLPMPEGVKPPKQTAINAYLKKAAAKVDPNELHTKHEMKELGGKDFSKTSKRTENDHEEK